MKDEIKINAVLILDIIGKPKEYLLESLEKHIANLDKEKGVVVKLKKIREPELMGNQEVFYTTFAEVEIEVDEILTLVGLMFKYMPAHVEIISPEMMGITNNVFNETLNELVRRLHGYDELARVMQTEKQVLIKKIKELDGEIPEGIMPLTVLRDPFEEVGADADLVEDSKQEPKKKDKKKKK
ncbi:MAG: hypothetical protein KJ905_02580 [Nanoarchaeota archaeon]|nr:hypothetical protein [Nanoarchaeota archaeon]MBU1501636.1 hypothetical protein [Nanoarchaeota archaeon]MBU2458904.1 hypothetical protein [Nanoarchaeota archaeon]